MGTRTNSKGIVAKAGRYGGKYAYKDIAFEFASKAAEREDFFDYPHIDVAIVDGDVVAFSAYTDEELAWLYVSPKWMRKGIARKLYESFGFRVHEIVKGSMPGNESFIVEVYSMHRYQNISI